MYEIQEDCSGYCHSPHFRSNASRLWWGGGQKKLMSYFPDEEGYSWEYEGTDGYVHRMTLDDIYEDSSTKEVTFTITGEIEGIEEEER